MSTEPGDAPDPKFEELLEYLRRSRGFDFTGYKRTSLARRVEKRMQLVGSPSYETYIDYLELHPEEFGALFDTILINVTAFFRDPTAWDMLRIEILPRLLAAKRPGDPIRVWSAGCASGEETYTLAVVLAEMLGLEQARDRVKIYGTDVDDEALSHARLAVYEDRQAQAIPPELLEKYFEKVGNRHSFRKDLRRSVIFGRHDLIQDAPISRIDMLACRNTLMYFNSETQSRILDRFHFALNDRGCLFLGKAETLLTYNNTFAAVDLKRRIFLKVPKGNLRDRLLVMARTGNDEAVNQLVGHVRIREATFDFSTVPQVVIDFSGLLTLANERARNVFGLGAADLGRPLQDLQISYRPVDLRSAIDRAYSERNTVVLEEVEWFIRPSETRYFDLYVTPLIDSGGSLLGASVTFLETTGTRRLKHDLQQTNSELETAYEELQSTNEELETTNEELQSTVEELETTNEELQSTNEELETMNEELQSTNEELEAVNDEVRQRSDELNQVNIYLNSILGSLRGGGVVIDSDLMVRIWNENAQELWGLRDDEALNKNFLNLDIGLPVDQLRPAIRTALTGRYSEVQVEATNRRGKAFRCRVACTPMHDQDGLSGAIIVMQDERAGSSHQADGDGDGESARGELRDELATQGDGDTDGPESAARERS